MLGGTLSTSPAQFTTIVASMFVNKTKTTLRTHTVDKNTSSVCGSKRRFRPKPHAPVLFLSITYGGCQSKVVCYFGKSKKGKRMFW